MSLSLHAKPAKPYRRMALIGTGAALALLAAANGHLVYVALSSQPDCVPHAKVPQSGDGGFRAARPSC